MSHPPLDLDVAGTGVSLVLRDYTLVVAGYTGRDEAAVREHIEELAAIGVPEPESVPAFYPLDAGLAVTGDTITVRGAGTSGEVEPLLVRAGGRLYLGVASDHTDRDIERDSVAASKAACPKPIGRTVVALGADLDWDSVTITSRVDGRPYQDGTLKSLRVPTDVLDLYLAAHDRPGDVVLLGGTVPVIGGDFVMGTSWEMTLEPAGGPRIALRYDVVIDAEGDQA
jgi:4-hydroxyphenylacetate 3-monooxygenase